MIEEEAKAAGKTGLTVGKAGQGAKKRGRPKATATKISLAKKAKSASTTKAKVKPKAKTAAAQAKKQAVVLSSVEPKRRGRPKLPEVKSNRITALRREITKLESNVEKLTQKLATGKKAISVARDALRVTDNRVNTNRLIKAKETQDKVTVSLRQTKDELKATRSELSQVVAFEKEILQEDIRQSRLLAQLDLAVDKYRERLTRQFEREKLRREKIIERKRERIGL